MNNDNFCEDHDIHKVSDKLNLQLLSRVRVHFSVIKLCKSQKTVGRHTDSRLKNLFCKQVP